jgi:NTP pyrophosphatase (non-canonical NTP hydrolase)
MGEAAATLTDLVQEIVRFRDARDWRQFHNPKDLSLAISVEAAELLEHFLWKDASQVEALAKDGGALTNLGRELADILIFTLLLADRLGIDPAEAIHKKLQENGEKYPVAKAKGTAKKYTEL